MMDREEIINSIVDEYPIDCGIDNNNPYTTKKYLYLGYFGNCINSVPRIWDATQMAGVVNNSNKMQLTDFLSCNIFAEDKPLPKRLMTKIQSGKTNGFYCGVNEYQKIAWLYDENTDVHFFFDAYTEKPRMI